MRNFLIGVILCSLILYELIQCFDAEDPNAVLNRVARGSARRRGNHRSSGSRSRTKSLSRMESSISDRRTVATRERGLHSLSAPTFENSASRSRMNFIPNNEGNGYSRLNSPYNQELLRECYYNYLWHC